MTDYQKAEVKMIQEVVHFFDENPQLEKDNAVLKTHVDKLRAYLISIGKYAVKQTIDTTGYAVNKKAEKQKLADILINISASICSYANDSGKNELYNEFNVPISKVSRMSDADIVNYGNTVLADADKYKKELEPYNLTAEELENLTKQKEAYSHILLIPAEQRKEKAVATDKIKKLIAEALLFIKRSVDFDMVHYKDTDADLYKTYENMREIDDSKTTALSVKGLVVDAHEPTHVLQHAKVTAQFKAGSALKEMKTTTSAKGNYQFKGIPDGKCSLTFELEYYDTLTKDIAVYSDKATDLDVELKKTI